MTKPKEALIKKQDDCIVCGSPVRVEGNVTKYYVTPLDEAKEAIRVLRGCLNKIKDKQDTWKDKGHECQSKKDLQAATDIARSALEATKGWETE